MTRQEAEDLVTTFQTQTEHSWQAVSSGITPNHWAREREATRAKLLDALTNPDAGVPR